MNNFDNKQRLDELINHLKKGICVFDIDGCLCRFQYTKNKDNLLPCANDDLINYLSWENNMYEYAEPIISMQYIINNLESEKIMTLSTAVPIAILLKNDWLNKHYSKIKKENRMWTKTDFDKIKILKKIRKEYDGEIFFIDDSYKTLLIVEEMKLDITLIHTSQFLV